LLGTFPIDTTKTRLQVQGQLDGQFNKIKYRGMVDAFCQIYKQEGFLSLYSGYLFIIIIIFNIYKSKNKK